MYVVVDISMTENWNELSIVEFCKVEFYNRDN